jgi:hypothetical protein
MVSISRAVPSLQEWFVMMGYALLIFHDIHIQKRASQPCGKALDFRSLVDHPRRRPPAPPASEAK